MLMFIKNKIELMHKMNSNYNVDYTHVHVYASENVTKWRFLYFSFLAKFDLYGNTALTLHDNLC